MKIIKYFFSCCLILVVANSIFAAANNIYYHNKNQFGDVYLVGNDVQRCIKTDLKTKALQSCYNPSNKDEILFEYIKAMLNIPKKFNNNPQKILVIGLGGGTLVKALNNMMPNAEIDVIEINPLMLEIATKYFGFNINDNIKVHIKDGYEFVMNSTDHLYDRVYIDAYMDINMPESFTQQIFIEQLVRIISKQGVVIVNFCDVNNTLSTVIENYKKPFAYFDKKVMFSSRSKVLYLSNTIIKK